MENKIDKVYRKDDCLIKKIKEKREFSKLPDSIVEKVAIIMKGDVKKSRALLRKYFGVFLTNRILKGKGSYDEILKAHMSSKKRNYLEFYKEIFQGKGFSSVIDFGAGANGYSYPYLREVFGDVNYFAVEAGGQLVENMNKFFDENHFSGRAICGDLMDLKFVNSVLKKVSGKKIIFMFQVVDALENLERDFSKKFLVNLLKQLNKGDLIVLTLPTESLGGRKKFAVRRKWIIDFLEKNFEIVKDFRMNGERIVVIKNKTNN